jgi:hypothetical protein
VIDVGEADLRRSVAAAICSIDKIRKELECAYEGLTARGTPASVASLRDIVCVY